MAIGDSGRVVLEIDPSFKREFYGALMKEGLTLKDWFVANATRYLEDQHQPSLFNDSKLEVRPLASEEKGANF